MSTTPHALETMRNVWEEMGCHVFQMDPDEHDAVYARISHLPQIISYALMRVAEDKEKSIPFFHHLPGPGWKDMTRLSRSNPELWTNICKGNREHILSSIHRFIGEMQAIQYELLQEQWDRIKNTFGESQMMALRLSDRGEV
jgi:prephenate dehydrogenase